MSEFINKRTKFTKYYLISGVFLLILTILIALFVYNDSRWGKIANKLSSNINEYNSIAIQTPLEKKLKDDYVKVSNLFLDSNKLIRCLSTAVIMLFPLFGGIHFLLLWRSNNKFLDYFNSFRD